MKTDTSRTDSAACTPVFRESIISTSPIPAAHGLNDNLSAASRQKKEAELMQEQQSFQQQQQMAQQQVQAEGQRMFEEVNTAIETFLADYGESNGFTYILGSSMQTKSVLYGEESLNITDEVIEALNASYETKLEVEEAISDEEPTPVN